MIFAFYFLWSAVVGDFCFSCLRFGLAVNGSSCSMVLTWAYLTATSPIQTIVFVMFRPHGPPFQMILEVFCIIFFFKDWHWSLKFVSLGGIAKNPMLFSLSHSDFIVFCWIENGHFDAYLNAHPSSQHLELDNFTSEGHMTFRWCRISLSLDQTD